MRCTRCSLPAFGLLGLFSSFALATPVLVTNPGDAQWGSAISGLTATPIDFSGLAVGGFETSYSNPNWPVLNGVTLQAGAAPGYVVMTARRWTSETVLIGPNASYMNGYLEILLPANVTAVSFNTAVGPMSAQPPSGGTISVLVNTSDSFALSTNSNQLSWLGVTSSTGITNLRLATSGDVNYLNPWLANLTYYTGSEPPPPPPPPPPETAEAETWILAVTGLVLMVIGAKSHDWGWGARRRAH